MHRFKDAKLVRDELSPIEMKELWDDKGVCLMLWQSGEGHQDGISGDMS